MTPRARRTPRAAPRLRCDAILFDLDGVLVNSVECVERTWRLWAQKHGLDWARVHEVAHGRTTLETVRLAAPHLVAETEAAAIAASESVKIEGVYEVPGTHELLEKLPARAWAIVTSGTRPVATLRLRHTRLPSPAVLICADDIRRGKPDPEGYLIAASQLGVRPEACVVIEDAPAGLQAARAAGMRAIGIEGTYTASVLAAADFTVPRFDRLRVISDGDRLEVSLAQSRAVS